MTAAEIKRIRELSEAKHLDGCSGFGKRCKACEFNSIARLAVPKLLDELERLKKLPEDCETCAGDGMMEVVTGHTPDDGELYAMEICAECHGTGDGHIADAHNKLRAELERLRERCSCTKADEIDCAKTDIDTWAMVGPCPCPCHTRSSAEPSEAD